MKDVINILNKLKDNNINISAVAGNLKIDIPKQGLDDKLKLLIQTHKKDILSYIEEFGTKESLKISNKKKESYLLSPSQKNLWIECQFNNASDAYIMSGMFQFSGSIDVEILKKSFYKVIKRHEILRTVFRRDKEGEVRQYIIDEDNLKNTFNFFENISKSEIVSKHCRVKFDLEKGPLIKANLFWLKENKYIFNYSMHHLISDGWSMEVLMHEMSIFYNSLKSNVAIEIPELKFQYGNYAEWLNEQLQSNDLLKQKEFWKTTLSGELPFLDFISSNKRPSIKSYKGGKYEYIYNKELVDKLKCFSTNNGGTFFMGLVSILSSFIYKYTLSEDIIIGTPVAGRDNIELNNQIGYYLNSVPLRIKIHKDDSFYSLFKRVKNIVVNAFDNKDFPFASIMQDLNYNKNISHSTLYNVSITLQNQSGSNVYGNVKNGLNNVDITPVPIIQNVSKLDMTFYFSENEEGLKLNLEYNTDLFTRDFISQIVVHFEQIMSKLLSNSENEIRTIQYLLEDELKLIKEDFNDSYNYFSKECTLVSLFQEQVELNPSAIAVVYENQQLSYHEVDEMSDNLAKQLITKFELNKGDFVGVYIDRSSWSIICLLGVLKSGGIYVPIDPMYPKGRVEQIIDEVKPKCIISQADYLFHIEQISDNIFIIDIEFDLFEKWGINLPLIDGKDYAYAIYTSGSTGNPKGILVKHAAVLNTILSKIKIYGLRSRQKILHMASISFDSSIAEIFNALLSGSELIIINESDKKDHNKLLRFINDNRIEVATIPISYLNLIDLDKLSESIKLLITGGESIGVELTKKLSNFFSHYNCYGPTEASICATMYASKNKVNYNMRFVPIGKPIYNSQIYILDKDLNVQPIGVLGEIYIGGRSLSSGYINRDSLNEISFIENPFNQEKLLYKTGDCGYWMRSGDVVFIGRQDNQVKIRGYRVELGEIENVINSFNSVSNSCVLLNKSLNNEDVITAFYTTDSEVEIEQLKNFIKGRLPYYMVPSSINQVQEIPININGKVDKKTLLEIKTDEAGNNNNYVPPNNTVETILVEIWSRVLNISCDKIGIENNFFDLGGNSLKVASVIVDIESKFEVNISFDLFFDYPTISYLAEYIGNENWIFNEQKTIDDSEEFTI